MHPSLTRFTAIAALALAVPAPLLAQQGMPPAGAHPYAQGNGSDRHAQGSGGRHSQGMSVQDMMAKMRSKYGRLDTNRDNRISATEWNTRKRSGKDHSRQFNKIDTNHDGYISVPELNAFVQRKATKADRNGDGIISPDERHHGGRGGKGGRHAQGRDQGGDQTGNDDQY